ncbi:MAG: hypothetical protein H6Q72_1232 [Firmicutes bacterium]|nr:hypothetical protein [Bacillota bacterium]
MIDNISSDENCNLTETELQDLLKDLPNILSELEAWWPPKESN